ncbi:MAG: hypothetical protein L0241_14055, partial [Planctomycetia bacterium]|nr:hypothetical protein [Planctomycetia bacterium]
ALFVAVSCNTANAQNDSTPYATLQQAGTPFWIARAAPSVESATSVAPSEMTTMPFGGHRDDLFVIAAQGQAPAGGVSGAEGGAGREGGGDGPDAGTDPSKAKRRFTLYSEYYRIQNGLSFNTTTANVTLPILGGGGTFGFNVPFTYTDVPAPAGNISAFGLSDVYARFIMLPTTWQAFKERCDWPFPNVIPVFGTDIYFPTAENNLLFNPLAARLITVSLGTQKYRLAPLVGFVWRPTERWSVIPVYFHDLSVAGNQNAASINTGKLRLFIQYQDPTGYYFKPEFQVVTDYNDNNRTEFYVAPELGKVFKGGTVFYVKPGVGFARSSLNRDWGIEAGIRTVF